MTDSNDSIGETLAMPIKAQMRRRLAELRMRPGRLAELTGLSPQRISNYLSGSRLPDPHTLAILAKALNTTPDFLLGIRETSLSALDAVLVRLFELEGLPPERADALAGIAIEALRIQASMTDGDDDLLRSRMAAHAAWLQRNGS